MPKILTNSRTINQIYEGKRRTDTEDNDNIFTRNLLVPTFFFGRQLSQTGRTK